MGICTVVYVVEFLSLNEHR